MNRRFLNASLFGALTLVLIFGSCGPAQSQEKINWVNWDDAQSKNAKYWLMFIPIGVDGASAWMHLRFRIQESLNM